MNILFLTLVEINSFDERGIYQDLLRKFIKEGHHISVVTAAERREQIKTNLQTFNNNYILQVKTLNIQKTNILEKGLGTLIIEKQFLNAIKKYLPHTKFDLILYSTPPITFVKVISFIKKRDQAKSYLLLKDIFPQNAVDIGLMKKGSFIHRFFRKKEKSLYAVSDFIGCMSPKNVEYLQKNNPELKNKIIDVCPNSIELINKENTTVLEKETIREKYNIPLKSSVFVYGGNLGKPQGLEFLLEVLKSNNNKTDRYFLIVGSGTEYSKIRNWFDINTPLNAKLIPYLPKNGYRNLVKSSDVGLIFLSKKFTTPNYPSRILDYLENKMPVLIATDVNTDIGPIAQVNKYGFWTLNGNLNEFNQFIDKFCNDKDLVEEMGDNGYEFLQQNYTVEKAYQIIMKNFKVDV